MAAKSTAEAVYKKFNVNLIGIKLADTNSFRNSWSKAGSL